MRRFSAVLAGTVSLMAATLGSAQAAPVFFGPTAYTSTADSPFTGPFAYFHLEDFEDHLFNVPGVTANVGFVTTLGFSGNIIDSVDNDDGSINGTCSKTGNCDSYFSSNGPGGIRFTFNSGALGGLPTHVGLVWTDGVNNQVFEAFDSLGNSLGTIFGSSADGDFFAGTGEDRFYGVFDAGGISAILMSSGGGGIEIDHLQYGLAGIVSQVPEPLTLSLFGIGVVGAAFARRRKGA